MSAFTFGFGGDDIDDQDVEDEMHDACMDAGMRQLHIASKESHDGEGGVLIEASQRDLDEMVCYIFYYFIILFLVLDVRFSIWELLVTSPRGSIVV